MYSSSKAFSEPIKKEFAWLDESMGLSPGQRDGSILRQPGDIAVVNDGVKGGGFWHMQEIEDFITMELQSRGCDDANLPCVARLQVFEEALDRFLSRCHMYRSFFDRYRREQNMLRGVYAARVAELPELRARADGAQLKADTAMETAKSSAAMNVAKLRDDVVALRRALAVANEDQRRERERNAEEALAYRRLHEEAEELRRATSMLTTSLGRLEEERERWALQENSTRSEALNYKSALEKSLVETERLRALAQDLEERKKDEGNEALKELETKLVAMRKENTHTQAQHRALQVRYRALASNTSARDVPTEESNRAKDAAAAKVVSEETNGMGSSDMKFDELIGGANELSPKGEDASKLHAGGGHLKNREHAKHRETHGPHHHMKKHHASIINEHPTTQTVTIEVESEDRTMLNEYYTPPGIHFIGRGTSDDVPPYLRIEGHVKNWVLSKRETERIINDVWVGKERFESQTGSREPLSNYLYQYLSIRFSSHTLAIEWGYNLLDSLERYIADSDCRLFLQILNGSLPEEVRVDQLAMLADVVTTMEREDKTLNNGKITSSLSLPTFTTALRKLLNTKSEHNFSRLVRQLQIEAQSNKSRVVHYCELLQSDSQGNQGKFCELLREQHLSEIVAFSQHVQATIHEATGNGNDTELPLPRLREALVKADPEKPRAEVNAYLARGAGVEPKELVEKEQSNQLCEVTRFIKNLKRGLLKRSTPVVPGPVGGNGGLR